MSTNRSSISCTRAQLKLASRHLRTRIIPRVLGQGGLRGRRSKRSEIDKAHVLHGGWESLAGSKYGGTQLSPPNCRDNATDGFDRNPYPPVFPLTLSLEFSSRSLSLFPPRSTSFSHSVPRSPLSSVAVFLRIFPRASFLPVDSIRHHATPCVRFHLSQTSVPLKDVGILVLVHYSNLIGCALPS